MKNPNLENPTPPVSLAADLNSTNMSSASQLSDCDIQSQFAPITPAKLDTLSQQDQGNNSFELPSSQESRVENPIYASLLDTPFKDGHNCSGFGIGIGIDLHKTPTPRPPPLKKPKKKKHKPRLIKEGQQENFPKSTPKENGIKKTKKAPKSTPKHKGTVEFRKVKRKYVRKNAATMDTQIDGVDQGAKIKSCKRSLNFDLEGEGGESVSNKKAKDSCGGTSFESCGPEVMLQSSSTNEMLGEQPTRKQLLKANMKVLAMLRGVQKEREKHGDSEMKDQDQMWQGYVPALPRHNEGVRNNKDVYSPGDYMEKVSSRSCVSGSEGTPEVVNMQNAMVPFKGDDQVALHEGKKRQRNRQNALVPYMGDNQIALYEEKKLRPKPKKEGPQVDIDPETIRVWNLLMGIEAGEGVEGTDADKEKWWEEERRVFRERVDFFIGRMYVIQGDRRFSPWSGSVVDSVVGVFLTQNVSDHLSSSAFMSLVARFPPKHTKTNNERTNMKVEVPEEAVDNSENTKCCDTVSSKQADIDNQPKSCESNNVMQQGHSNLRDNSGEMLEDVESDVIESSTILKQKENLANAKSEVNWDDLRNEVYQKHGKRERKYETMDSVDWDAVLHAKQSEIAHVIRKRGQNNIIAWKIQEFLKRLVKDHESIDLEWLRDVRPDKAKEFLLSFHGLGPKSVDCISLLNLHHHAFPVDTNIQRIAVRLGWAPLQPLPEDIQLHDLQKYPEMENIQKYLWPRLCTLDQDRLYELHYQMITFGKVFCGKVKPNCNACPMRSKCKHFASAFASNASSTVPALANQTAFVNFTPPETNLLSETMKVSEPIIEEPASPEFDFEEIMPDIEDAWWQKDIENDCHENHEPIIEQPASPEVEFDEILEHDSWKQDIEDNDQGDYENSDEIILIKLNTNDFEVNSQKDMQANMHLQDCDMSVILSSACIPQPKLKNVRRLRTEHQVYELKDDHTLLAKVDKRIAGDVCKYLLVISPPTGETVETDNTPQTCCDTQKSCNLCNDKRSSSSEGDSQTVKGILLIPSRTAMKGFFPLNGTYFQVNEVFVDHASCLHPIDVPRDSIAHLPRRTVYCGTSISSIFKDMTTEEVHRCFWEGYVCVRSFDQITRLPESLKYPMHGSNSQEAAAKPKGKGSKSNKPVKKTKGKGVAPESKE